MLTYTDTLVQIRRIRGQAQRDKLKQALATFTLKLAAESSYTEVRVAFSFIPCNLGALMSLHDVVYFHVFMRFSRSYHLPKVKGRRNTPRILFHTIHLPPRMCRERCRTMWTGC